jgi:site-specific DNA recombinase
MVKTRGSRSAAIYARISQDRSDGAQGVNRQIRDCTDRAAELAWTVVDVYRDNDTSAYGRKRRPEYQRMLADIRAGAVTAVLAWHPDRLYRRLDDLAEFVDVCKEFGVEVDTVQTGRVDLSTPSGRMIAGILGVTARFESEHKSERVTSAMEQRAARGLHHGGQRPFGYESDGMTLRPSEAGIAKEAVERFIAGYGLVGIARWINEQGVATVMGKGPWQVSTTRQLLRSARLSGQVERHGEIVGPAQWPAIVTPEQTHAVRSILDDPSRRQQRTARRFLLSRMLICSHCHSPMTGETKAPAARYVCKPAPHRPQACGRISIVSEPVDALIVEAVLQRLDNSHLAKALSDNPHDSVLSASRIEAKARDRLDLLAEMLGDGSLTRTAYEKAKRTANEQLASARAAQANATKSADLSRWITKTGTLRAAWPTLTLTQQRRIIEALLDHAVVLPGKRGARYVDIERIDPIWRSDKKR